MEGVCHPIGRTENWSGHTGESTDHLHDRQATHGSKKEANKDDKRTVEKTKTTDDLKA